jgi:preprotein translocase subunit SecB
MRPSALLLKRYIVTEVNVAANRVFDPAKPVNLGLQDVVVEPVYRPNEKNPREWQIILRVKHSQKAECNAPYFFMIELVGFFTVNESIPDANVRVFAEVNGASVLFSTAREVLRSLMCMGPYQPILLPAACFFEEKHKLEGGGGALKSATPAAALDAGAPKTADEPVVPADVGTAKVGKARAKQAPKQKDGEK